MCGGALDLYAHVRRDCYALRDACGRKGEIKAQTAVRVDMDAILSLNGKPLRLDLELVRANGNTGEGVQPLPVRVSRKRGVKIAVDQFELGITDDSIATIFDHAGYRTANSGECYGSKY
jgi:hypothetical protein